MLTITNGIDTLTVTKGAYATLFKHQGFTIVGSGAETLSPENSPELTVKSTQAETAGEGAENEAVVTPGEPDTGDTDPENHAKHVTSGDDDEEDETEEDLSEIPLSDMNKTQLIKYADRLGVDFTGEETKKELRDAIRAALN